MSEAEYPHHNNSHKYNQCENPSYNVTFCSAKLENRVVVAKLDTGYIFYILKSHCLI